MPHAVVGTGVFNGRIIVHTQWHDKDLIKSIPGSRFDPTAKKWHVPLTYASGVALRGVFGDRLTIGQCLADVMWQERRTRVDPAMSMREQLSHDSMQAVSEGHKAYDDDTRYFSFQRAAIDFMQTAGSGLLADDMGTGKGHLLTDTVPTPSGNVCVNDLMVGDIVFGSDGNPTQVTGVYPRGVQPVYSVRFYDGTLITVDKDHLWYVRDSNGRFRTIRTETLNSINLRTNPLWIPLTKPVQYPTQQLPIAPYTMGALLANGYLCGSTVQLTTPDTQVVTHIRAEGTQVNDWHGIQWGIPGVIAPLNDLGLYGKKSRDKFIPTQYLHANVSQRTALLAGLLDGDGSVRRSNGQARYSTMSPYLADNLTTLVQSLGGMVVSRQVHTRDGEISLSISIPFNPFMLERKSVHWKCGMRQKMRKISAVECAGVAETLCISVAAENHLYLAHDYIVTHNTIELIGLLRSNFLRHRAQDTASSLSALIICPNSLKTHWADRMSEWFPEVKSSIYVVDGPRARRMTVIASAQNDPMAVVIINIESLRSFSRLAPYGSIRLKKCIVCDRHNGDPMLKPAQCEVHPKQLNGFGFRTVILDEGHRIKDPKSKQTRATWAVMHDPSVHTRWVATGTPIAHHIDDLWSLMHAVTPDEYPSRTKFIDRYARTDYNPFGGLSVCGMREDTRDELRRFFEPRFRRVHKSVVLDQLPPLTHQVRIVELSPTQKRMYKELTESLAAESPSGELILAPSQLAALTRLSQLAAASLDIQDTQGSDDQLDWRVRLKEPSTKLDELMTLLDELEGRQVVVAADHSQLIDLACRRLEKAHISHAKITGDVSPHDRNRALVALQSGRIRVLLFTAKAGGVGLDMSAASELIFLQHPWSVVDYKQAADRVYRIGSERHAAVTITHIIAGGTVEVDKMHALERKLHALEQITNDRSLLEQHGKDVSTLDVEQAALLNSWLV